MRILLALFLVNFLSLSVYGQGYGREIAPSEMYKVITAQPLEGDQLFLKLQNWYTGSGPNSYSTYYAIYDEASDQLLYHDLAYRVGNDYGHVIQRNGDQLQYLVSHASFGFVTFKYLDLSDTATYPGLTANHSLMGPPFLWLNDTAFFLRSLYDPWTNRAQRSQGLNTLNDTLILGYCNFANNRMVDLDTFRFSFSIGLNSYFAYNKSEDYFELIQDSLRATFKRGDRQMIVFRKQKDWFWHTAKKAFPDDAKQRNKRIKELRLAGGIYREVKDTLGLIKLTWIEGPNGPFNLRPFYIPVDLRDNQTYGAGNYQSDSVYNYYSLDADSSYYTLVRYEGGEERHRSRFPFDVPATFELSSLSSRADGSFYLSGLRNYENPFGWDSWAEAYLIRVDKNGYIETLNPGERFALHWEREAQRLKIFYADGLARLDYRIVDASGRQMQSGAFQAYEGIKLGDWREGIYYVQLWTEGGSFIGEESFLMSPR